MHLVLLWLTLSVFVLPLSLPVMIGSVCPLFGCHGHSACVCHCLSCSCCVSAVLRAIVVMPVMYGMKTLCHRCQPSKTTKTGRPTNTAHRSVDVARSWPSINTHIRFGTSPRRHLNPSTTCQFVFSFRCMQRRETTLWLDSSQANNVTIHVPPTLPVEKLNHAAWHSRRRFLGDAQVSICCVLLRLPSFPMFCNIVAVCGGVASYGISCFVSSRSLHIATSTAVLVRHVLFA